MKDWVATENCLSVVYKIDCSNCESVYFFESKRSSKLHSDEDKTSVRSDCESNEFAKHWWEADHNFN